MKTLVVFAFVGFIAGALTHEPINLSPAQENQVIQDLDDCIKQENLTEAQDHDIKNWDIGSPSSGMKCVSACFFEKFGLLKDNQIRKEIAAEKLKPIINEKRTDELLSRCGDIKGGDRCETGFKIFQCVWNYRAF